MRTITIPNRNHPLWILKDYLQQMKERHRSLPNNVLTAVAVKLLEEELEEPRAPGEGLLYMGTIEALATSTRKEKLSYILHRAERQFKAHWKKEYGWDFDDAHDDEKLRKHIAARLEKEKENNVPALQTEPATA